MKKLNDSGIAHLALILFVVVAFAVVGSYLLVKSRAQTKNNNTNTTSKPVESSPTTGNGAPSGAHFTLNVIGVPKDKTGDFSGGSRMFVPLEGNCRVNLSPGDFSVLDGNCTDNTAAFQLPHPDPDGDGETSYSVYARPLGKPGGKATATTCATDPTTGEEVCSIESTAFVRTKGKSEFSNVSKGFLTVLADLDGDPATAPQRVSIFDEALQDYFWSYDNNGLKNLQLRFYQQATNVNQ